MNLVSLRFQIALFFFFFFPLIQPETHTMVQTIGRSGSWSWGAGECGKRSGDKVPAWFRPGQRAQGYIRGLRKS